MSDSSKHPCFNREAGHQFGRIHLPVAPRCNIQCNFCNRKYDCLNESRPGVTSVMLTPPQALAYLTEAVGKRPEITVMGIAGPGDPFADPEKTMQTLRLVHERFPDMLLCVATNGLGIGPYIDELAQLQVSHVSITINAVDPKIGARIYAWVRDGKQPLRGEPAAVTLLERQLDALERLKAHGIMVKINSIIMPGINDQHLADVAKAVAALGADIMNCMPMVPVPGAEFEDLLEPDAVMIARLRLLCGQLLPQMTHCTRCRADAAGLISEEMTTEQLDALRDHANRATQVAEDAVRPFVAVASQEGALVNQHLGEAARVLVYEPHPRQAQAFQLKEIRQTPASGSGEARWAELANTLSDCRAFLVVAAGSAPRRVLTAHGVRVIEMEGLIEEGLRAVYADQPIPPTMARRFMGCSKGVSCRGTGTGCG